MRTAFDLAWRNVQASGAPWAETRYADRARRILADAILKSVRTGETDEDRLRDIALLELARTPLAKLRDQSPDHPDSK